MSSLLLHPSASEGEYVSVTPQNAGWEHLSFGARRLARNTSWQGHTGDSEYGFVILGGVCAVKSSRAQALEPRIFSSKLQMKRMSSAGL